LTGHGFARREPDTLAALQVTDGERMIVLDLTGTGDGDWQTNESPRELSIDFLRPLRQWRTRFIEEQRPVDCAVTRHRAESQEIGKERHRITL
jgi:hypothetical protein